MVVEQNVALALDHADWAYVLIAGENFMDGPAREVKEADLASIFLGQAQRDRVAQLSTAHTARNGQ